MHMNAVCTVKLEQHDWQSGSFETSEMHYNNTQILFLCVALKGNAAVQI